MVTLFLLGILIAVILEETTGLSPGGVVTIPFLALLTGEPHLLATVVVVSFITWGVLLFAEKHIALFGRRRLSLAILISALVKALFITVIPGLSVSAGGFLFLGFLVPGVMADWYRRQGPAETLSTLVAGLGIVALVRLGVGL